MVRTNLKLSQDYLKQCADPDPGSQKFPYGSGSGCGSGSKEVNTKEEQLHKQFLN